MTKVKCYVSVQVTYLLDNTSHSRPRKVLILGFLLDKWYSLNLYNIKNGIWKYQDRHYICYFQNKININILT